METPQGDLGPRTHPVARRGLMAAAALGLGVVVAGCSSSEEHTEDEAAQRDDEAELTASLAERRLSRGNERFVNGETTHPDQAVSRREALASGQKPFVAVLSCADSRVPPEIVFDQGLGDLFVVRSAGQVIDKAVMGSLQYGVEHLEVPLVVVLGHSACGAVKATVEAVSTKAKASGTDIDALVEAITPAAETALGQTDDEEKAIELAVEANVENIMAQLEKNELIEEFVTKGLVIKGAVYELETGEVTFL